MYITKLLAECIADRVFDAVPVEVRNKALCCLFDAATCALAGNLSPGRPAPDWLQPEFLVPEMPLSGFRTVGYRPPAPPLPIRLLSAPLISMMVIVPRADIQVLR